MSKLRVSTREIGSVRVFDLEGVPTQETLQEIAWKIQRNIRRYRLQRVILNLQMLRSLDQLGLRKLLAACIRPQRSLIYGASDDLILSLADTYLPRNVRICATEKEVAEDLGPFLLEKEREREIMTDVADTGAKPIGDDLERRRAKRMHVAIPFELRIFPVNGEPVTTRAIATNISEGGLFAEFLDLEITQKIAACSDLKGVRVEIQIFPSNNFPEEYHLEGRIVRTELRKKQLGVGVQFVSPKGPEI